MRRIMFAIVMGVVIGLQLGFVPAMRPLGVVPDLALVMVVLVGLMGTASRALVVAVVAGLLLDLSSGSDFGLRTAVLVLAALVTGIIHRAGLETFGILVPATVVAVVTLLTTTLIAVDMAGATAGWSWWTLLRRLGIEIMLNLALVVLMRPVVGWLSPPESDLPQIA